MSPAEVDQPDGWNPVIGMAVQVKSTHRVGVIDALRFQVGEGLMATVTLDNRTTEYSCGALQPFHV